jgi:hypothetical protein
MAIFSCLMSDACDVTTLLQHLCDCACLERGHILIRHFHLSVFCMFVPSVVVLGFMGEYTRSRTHVSMWPLMHDLHNVYSGFVIHTYGCQRQQSCRTSDTYCLCCGLVLVCCLRHACLHPRYLPYQIDVISDYCTTQIIISELLSLLTCCRLVIRSALLRLRLTFFDIFFHAHRVVSMSMVFLNKYLLSDVDVRV